MIFISDHKTEEVLKVFNTGVRQNDIDLAMGWVSREYHLCIKSYGWEGNNSTLYVGEIDCG